MDPETPKLLWSSKEDGILKNISPPWNFWGPGYFKLKSVSEKFHQDSLGHGSWAQLNWCPRWLMPKLFCSSQLHGTESRYGHCSSWQNSTNWVEYFFSHVRSQDWQVMLPSQGLWKYAMTMEICYDRSLLMNAGLGFSCKDYCCMIAWYLLLGHDSSSLKDWDLPQSSFPWHIE